MATTKTSSSDESWDVFISYATEDKEAVAEPLARALMKARVSVWYDGFSLKVGDSLMSSIDDGLRKSKFGIVILSKAFFRKDWPQRELRALAQKQSANQKVILPIWHDVTLKEVQDHFLLLADAVALKWSDGIQTVVDHLVEVILGTESPRLAENRDAQFRERATMSPRGAITEKWKELIEATLNAGLRNEAIMKPAENRNPNQIIHTLFSTELLDESDKETFFSLKRWHFDVTFDRNEPVEPQDTLTFAELANKLKAKLAST